MISSVSQVSFHKFENIEKAKSKSILGRKVSLSLIYFGVVHTEWAREGEWDGRKIGLRESIKEPFFFAFLASPTPSPFTPETQDTNTLTTLKHLF